MLWAIMGLGILIVYQKNKVKTAAAAAKTTVAAGVTSAWPAEQTPIALPSAQQQPQKTTSPDAWEVGDILYPTGAPSPGAGGLGIFTPLGSGGGVTVVGAAQMMDQDTQTRLAWVESYPSLFSKAGRFGQPDVY